MITIERVTSWKRALNAARWTVNKLELDKEPTDKWKRSMLIAEHSPIRLVEYDVKITDIPNKVVMHLVRHNKGCEKFVGTHRSDRTDFDDIQVHRMTPTSLWFSANTQALINVSKVRLCTQADVDTRNVWNAVKKEMEKVEPLLARCMVKACVYRGFCPELNSCKYTSTNNFKNEVLDYRQMIL